MLRSSRIVVSLVHTLSLSPLVLGTLAATTLVGCKDESQPEYWVDKLKDPAWQSNAVKRLEQFFEDTFTRSNKDLTSPDVKALADKVIDPATALYVGSYDDLDDKTRESLVKLIAAFRDKRGEPALKKSFDEFAKTGKGGEDVRWASRAQAEMKLDSLNDSIGNAFAQLKASRVGASVYLDLKEAMVTHPSPAWSAMLKSKLDADIVPPGDGKDPTVLERFRNEQYWQTVAAQLLGELKDESAVEPLIKVMLDPAKADVQATAALALVKIGKPAAARAVKLLSDQDPTLAAYSIARVQKATGAKEVPKDKPYISTAAVILGVMGRPETLDAMVTALKAASDESTRAIIAREIAKIPPTPASKLAFRQAYESISLDTQIPPGANALETLTESSSQFYDPEFVPWLLERAEKTKGTGEDKSLLQTTALLSAIKLMKQDQVGIVGDGVKKWGSPIEKDAFQQSSGLLQACGSKEECFLANIEKSENQDRSKQAIGIKAGYMFGVLGNDQARGQLIDGLSSIDNAALRFVAAQTIDFLSPKGSLEAADALQKIIDKNAKTADKDKIANDEPLKQVMFRIRARAQ
ncbi:MAG TPA: HEAT repeat domain-containing protein [Polyangiaceae bacterium]|jgi:HEAT repeat protein|nr:HEAT repeat domain-containing protein [Polyangiaceae bacterium]